ncbi:unnamed protein product, partial [Timema podura]|nr:unnamed protein product [Timema podura]
MEFSCVQDFDGLFINGHGLAYDSDKYESGRGMNDTSNNIQCTAIPCDEWSEGVTC